MKKRVPGLDPSARVPGHATTYLGEADLWEILVKSAVWTEDAGDEQIGRSWVSGGWALFTRLMQICLEPEGWLGEGLKTWTMGAAEAAFAPKSGSSASFTVFLVPFQLLSLFWSLGWVLMSESVLDPFKMTPGSTRSTLSSQDGICWFSQPNVVWAALPSSGVGSSVWGWDQGRGR